MLGKIAMSAIVLAGGKSSRMGRDKALLPFGKRTMLEHLAAITPSLFEETWIVVDQKSKTEGLHLEGAQVCEDLMKHRGPLAGLYTGLCASHLNANCVLTCDMPLVDEALLRNLVDYWDSDLDGLCLEDAKGHLQPFPGIYSRSCRLLMRSLLDVGEASMKRFLQVAVIKPLPVSEETEPAFTNMNTPEDYRVLLEAKKEASRD